MPTLTIRPARPDDVDIAVPILHSSMAGVADHLYSGDAHLTVDDYLGKMFKVGGHRFSWDLSFIAEADGRPVGMLLSYPGKWVNRFQLALILKLPALYGWTGFLRVLLRFIPLIGSAEAEADEYYISNIGVLPEFQNCGYGAQLMAFAEQQTCAAGLSKCSLTVDAENHGAIRFYERLGYKIVYSKIFEGEVAKQESGYHRMLKNLTTLKTDN